MCGLPRPLRKVLISDVTLSRCWGGSAATAGLVTVRFKDKAVFDYRFLGMTFMPIIKP